MGYMGFGMLSWVYNMKPRKPFSVERKTSFTAVPVYKRKFKLQHSKPSTKKVALIALIILLIVTPVSFSMVNQFLKHSKTITTAKQKLDKKEDEIAFDFLLESGINRLYSKDYKGAFSEFKLAYKINPKHLQTQTLIIETLTVLCVNNNDYCSYLDKFLNEINSF